MARDSKVEVAAINIRIPSSSERNYTKLISDLNKLRRGIRVYGDSYLAISSFDEHTGWGIFSKYTEIDVDGTWFDLNDFDTASPEQIEKISIPDTLKPNHFQFYFRLDTGLHAIAFSSYSESRGLSTRSVENYFKGALKWIEIRNVYGRVEADIVSSYGEVEKLLSLPNLKELRLILRRPNGDDISDDLAAEIEKRLREQQGDEYEETLKAKGEHNLQPNERTRKLGNVAAENGELRTKSLVNGVLTEQTTADIPLKEVETFKPSEEDESSVFLRLANRVFGKISEMRARANG